MNKTCCDKLTSMYKNDIDEEEDKIFEKEDSLLVIINEPVSESMEKSVESVYHAGQDTLTKGGLSTQITGEMKENDFIMNQSYFRNIHMFHIDIITVNILNHTLVPLHEPIRKQDEIDKILQLTNSTEHQLPIILRTDNIAKLIRLCPGNIEPDSSKWSSKNSTFVIVSIKTLTPQDRRKWYVSRFPYLSMLVLNEEMTVFLGAKTPG